MDSGPAPARQLYALARTNKLIMLRPNQLHLCYDRAALHVYPNPNKAPQCIASTPTHYVPQMPLYDKVIKTRLSNTKKKIVFL